MDAVPEPGFPVNDRVTPFDVHPAAGSPAPGEWMDIPVTTPEVDPAFRLRTPGFEIETVTFAEVVPSGTVVLPHERSACAGAGVNATNPKVNVKSTNSAAKRPGAGLASRVLITATGSPP